MMNTALSMVSKSLSEPTPQNFDNCITDYRIIVEYSGKDEKVSVLKAEILNMDWELMPEESILFIRQVTHIVEIRNAEFKQLINQSKQIMKDRTF